MGRNLRSRLNPNLFAGTGMPMTQMEKENLWDTTEDKFWERDKQRVHVRLESDSRLEDEEKLAELSGEVKTYHIDDLKEAKDNELGG